jgi:hypothetical protein
MQGDSHAQHDVARSCVGTMMAGSHDGMMAGCKRAGPSHNSLTLEPQSHSPVGSTPPATPTWCGYPAPCSPALHPRPHALSLRVSSYPWSASPLLSSIPNRPTLKGGCESAGASASAAYCAALAVNSSSCYGRCHLAPRGGEVGLGALRRAALAWHAKGSQRHGSVQVRRRAGSMQSTRANAILLLLPISDHPLQEWMGETGTTAEPCSVVGGLR